MINFEVFFLKIFAYIITLPLFCFFFFPYLTPLFILIYPFLTCLFLLSLPIHLSSLHFLRKKKLKEKEKFNKVWEIWKWSLGISSLLSFLTILLNFTLDILGMNTISIVAITTTSVFLISSSCFLLLWLDYQLQRNMPVELSLRDCNTYCPS